MRRRRFTLEYQFQITGVDQQNLQYRLLLSFRPFAKCSPYYGRPIHIKENWQIKVFKKVEIAEF